MTDGERSEQQILEVVVNLSEERNEVVALLDTTCTLGAGSGIGIHIVVVLYSKHLCIGICPVLDISVELNTTQYNERVIQTKVEAIVGRI